VAALVKRQYGVVLSLTTVGCYLKSLGMTAKSPFDVRTNATSDMGARSAMRVAGENLRLSMATRVGARLNRRRRCVHALVASRPARDAADDVGNVDAQRRMRRERQA
jgi:hypothetical protein